MNPFFFGTSERSLFGVYHPPKAKQARRAGVVLCYPMGQEYMRAHRAFRQLTMLLQKAGFHVLRFDYYGTGDSAGDSDSGTLAQWTEDVRTAVDELKDTAGVERVALVGLRLGAALAVMAAAPRQDIQSVVMWDPVVRGADYLAELLESRVGAHAGAAAGGTGETISVMGFPVTPALRGELERFNLFEIAAPAGVTRYVVVSQERPEYTEAGKFQPPGGGTVSFELLPTSGSWTAVDDFGGVLIPQQLIQAIVVHLTKEAR